jgi:hypothetical protein
MSEAPFISAEVDLRDYSFMPLDVVRLRDSDLAALSTGDEFRAAVLLWCASWHQVPAASLPNDDRLLSRLAGFGRDVDGWLLVRSGALRGFLECSDGRLYHPVIADKAIEAWEKKKRDGLRTANATAARLRKLHAEKERYDQHTGQRDDNVASDVTFTKGEENKGEERAPHRPPSGGRVDESFFERFWTTYPRRDGANPRKPARDRFRSACKSGAEPEAIIAGADSYRLHCEARELVGTPYVAQATTWLNQQRWLDDYGDPSSRPGKDIHEYLRILAE